MLSPIKVVIGLQVIALGAMHRAFQFWGATLEELTRPWTHVLHLPQKVPIRE